MTTDDLARWDDDGGAQPVSHARRTKLYRVLRAAVDKLELEGKYTPPAGHQSYPRRRIVRDYGNGQTIDYGPAPVTIKHRTADPYHDLPFDFEYAE